MKNLPLVILSTFFLGQAKCIVPIGHYGFIQCLEKTITTATPKTLGVFGNQIKAEKHITYSQCNDKSSINA